MSIKSAVLEPDRVETINSVTVESQMTVSGQRIVADAKAMRIVTAEDYENAGNALRKIKDQMKQVKDYWSGPKTKAKAAHQEIVDKEKAMLKFFTDAETIIKGNMKAYLDAVEKARREAEAEARRRQEEEAMRLVDEAAKAEANGDNQTAAVNMAMAEMVNEMPVSSGIVAPKAQGISARKTWKARVINEALVPPYAMGMEIRQINMSVLNNIARMSKGTAQISGVEFFEDTTIGARI